MLDVTVKTLDGKNSSFSVPDDITVKEFKEKIAESISITVENQRLIFMGRVLQDEKKLNDFDVNGKVLHAVERPPPSSRGPSSDATATSARSQPSASGPRASTTQQPRGTAMEFHVSVRDLRREATVSEAQKRLTGARRMVAQARRVLDAIENIRGSSTEETTPSQTGESSTDTSTSTGQGRETVITNGEVTEGGESAVSMDTGSNEEGTSTTSLCGAGNVTGQSTGQTGGQQTEDPQIDSNHTSDMMGGAEAIVIETVEAEMEIEVDEENGTLHVNHVSQSSTPHVSHNVDISSGDAGSQTTGAGTETGTQTTQSTSTGTQTDNQSENAECPPSSLAELLDSVFEVNQRLQPHLVRYRAIMGEEPSFDGQQQTAQDTQTFTDRVSEVLHCISHTYHNISDLMIDTSIAPPRQLTAHPTVLQQRVNSETHQTIATAPLGAMGTPLATSISGANQPGGAVPPMSLPTGGPLSFMQPHSDGFAIGSISAHIMGPNARGPGNQTTPTTATATSTTPGVSQTNQAPGSTTTTTTTPQSFPQMPGAPPISVSGGGNVRINVMQGPQGMMRGTTGGAGGGMQFARGGQQPASINIHIGRGAPGAMGPQGMRPGMIPMFPGAMGMRAARHVHGRRGGAHRGRGARGGNGGNGGGGGGGSRQSFGGGSAPPHSEGVTNMENSLPCYSRHFLRQRPSAEEQEAEEIDVIPAVLPTVISTVIGGIVQHVNSQGPSPSSSSTNPPSNQHSQPGVATSTSSGVPPPPQGAAPVLNPFAALFGGDMNIPMNMNQAATGGAGGLQMGNFMDQLRNVLQQQVNPNQQPAANTTTPTPVSTATRTTSAGATPTTGGQASSTPGGQRAMTDDMFTQLVSSIGQMIGQASSGQAPQGTITDFLANMGEEFRTPQGESILSDIFNVLSSCISFIDLMQIFAGSSAALQNAREPLQRYIRDQLMQGEPVNTESIERCVDRQMEIAAPVIEQACVNLRTRDDIDFEASMNTFLENQANQVISFIMNARESDADFHSNLYTRVRRFIHELVIMGENSLQGGFDAVVQLVQDRVNAMASDVSPMIRQWMSSMTAGQIRLMRPGIRLTASDVQQYMIRGGQQQQQQQQKMETGSDRRSSDDNEDFLSADEDVTDGNSSSESKKAKYDNSTGSKGAQNSSPQKPIGSQEQPTTSTSSSQNTSSGVKPKTSTRRTIQPRVAPEGGDMPFRQTEGEPPYNENGELQDIGYSRSSARLRPQMTPMAYHTVRCAARPRETDRPQVNNQVPQDWHSVVPQEWVDVIATDVERQRTMQNQRPLSDAYMGGNPSKKRKVAKNRSETEELALPTDSIPEAILSAATAVGAQPITSLDSLSQEVESSVSLQQAFHNEIRGEVRRQLRDNKDFIPHKYNSTEKYFGNKK